jgi:hypothetical protein
MIVTIREPEPLDVQRVACAMRWIDVIECRVAGHTPVQALITAKKQSVMCWTGDVDGWPEAMFGVVPISASTGLGSPWFLGSARARKAQRLFLSEAPKYLERIETLFPRLEGMVSANNHSARRWLVRMGFDVEKRYQVLSGEPMQHFRKGF